LFTGEHRLALPRFTIKDLLIATAIVAVLLGASCVGISVSDIAAGIDA
jgi:hypothetical protein